jgi:hypothetical protein
MSQRFATASHQQWRPVGPLNEELDRLFESGISRRPHRFSGCRRDRHSCALHSFRLLNRQMMNDLRGSAQQRDRRDQFLSQFLWVLSHFSRIRTNDPKRSQANRFTILFRNMLPSSPAPSYLFCLRSELGILPMGIARRSKKLEAA